MIGAPWRSKYGRSELQSESSGDERAVQLAWLDGVPEYTVNVWLVFRPLVASPGEGKRVRRVARPGGYKQSATFPCLHCGYTVSKRRVVEHIKPAREGELSECKLNQKKAAERP